LQRGRTDLFDGCRRFKVEQRFDASAHDLPIISRMNGCRKADRQRAYLYAMPALAGPTR
jgi:hypothetical protein